MPGIWTLRGNSSMARSGLVAADGLSFRLWFRPHDNGQRSGLLTPIGMCRPRSVWPGGRVIGNAPGRATRMGCPSAG